MTYPVPQMILPTREQVNSVLHAMHDRIKNYGDISVGDLNELLGVTGVYTDEQFGWSRIEVTKISPVVGGFLLELPPASKLHR